LRPANDRYRRASLSGVVWRRPLTGVDRSLAQKVARDAFGSISYSQGGRSNDRDLSTAVLRAGSANALRGHRQCRGLAVPTNPAGRSGTFMDGSPRSAGKAAACTHGDGRQHWQADDGVPPVQSALRNAINLSSGR
jgi:hypothetical protein